MFGQVLGGNPIFPFEFTLTYVPGSMPARWEGVVNWQQFGGSQNDVMHWFPNGGSDLWDMSLQAFGGCLFFLSTEAANFPGLSCSTYEWRYLFNTIIGCPGFATTFGEYKIRATPFS